MTKGVEIRGGSIRVNYRLDGATKKGTLMSGGKPLPVTQANIKYAERVAAQIRTEIRLGVFVASKYFETAMDGGTVEKALQVWLSSIRVADSTRKAYETAARFWCSVDVGGAFGAKLTRSVRHSHIAIALRTLDGKSGKTINNYRSVLSSALELQVLEGTIEHNPCNSVPWAKWQKDPPDPFTLSEVWEILKYAEKHWPAPVHLMLKFWFFSGLRTSELFGLRWGSVDWKGGKVLIHEARVRGQDKANTKTDRTRLVELNSQSLEALKAMKAHTFMAGDRVFVNPRTGEAWNNELAFRRFWAPALKALGILYRRAYNCRHTFATMLLMSGARPMWVADQMGHDLKVLLDRYARWLPDGRTQAEVDRLEAFIDSTAARRKEA